MSLGNNLKILRKRNRLSQIQLATMVGLTERTIYNYEREQKVPKDSTLDLLADALGVTPDLLLHGDPEKDFMSVSEYDALRQKMASAKSEFIQSAKERFGLRGAIEAFEILEQATALFAGGTLSEEAKDEFFESIAQAYFLAKRKSKLKNEVQMEQE